ncbi:hypothetical protein E1B28_006368 [Marasmius oreades]|uniref:ABC transmembrane type-1 domain-containing protein n=1 Tax=Marasmius oreades TaxID=181124 RepID=A0A9P7S777_9AGAR|nr:uncharacterized protein E1B28_006368 [Marasmius oreades]KAG7095646.1 hypothetical protein E1B28_006368 [Marasmius oreades]
MEGHLQLVINVANPSKLTQTIWTSELIFPLYVTLGSTLVLVLHLVFTAKPFKKFVATRNEELVLTREINEPSEGLVEEVKAHVSNHGGTTIFTFYLTRLTCTLGLLLLAITSLVQDFEEGHEDFGVLIMKKKNKKHRGNGSMSDSLTTREWLEFAMCLTFLYTVLLAITSVSAKPRWSRVVIRHLNVVLLATSAVYTYRDLYPLATFNKTPLDIEDGWRIWAKVALLSISAIVIPLLIPRHYVPYNPKNPSQTPNPEQTASLLSLTLYFFMDPVIFSVRKNEHLPYDQLPPLPDYDYAEGLRERAFRHLDPTLRPKRRHLFFSLVRVFLWEHFILSLMLIIQVTTGFATPFAVKGLLNYLEQMQYGSSDATMRPWFWIALMFIGPTISSVAFEWYIFVGTHMIVQAESLLTQVIFEHALRIRLKSEGDRETSQATPTQDTTDSDSSNPVSRESTLVPSDDDNISGDDGSVRSGTDTTATAAEASTSHAREDTLVDTTSSLNRAKSKTAHSDAAKPSVNIGLPPLTRPISESGNSNMIGKIINLASTDLQTILDTKDFIRLLVYTPIQLVLCVMFLYFVLGWSAFVGLGVIFLSLPIPGVLASLVRKVQVNRMKQTDARVQAVTEIMNVIRMVKMFGWEQKMNDRISEKRDKEMFWIWRLRLLNMATMIINYVIPMSTMIATYATYVSPNAVEMNGMIL